ncbi:potassium channel family protein [Halobacillus salinarum]|uniref:Potassium channel family protein n=1 Tax=Halobacillus salinarum TaxID=2932257 RepID=A0ABY4ENN1_9BACI|nr:potassium channel family protein [Halobacillus salinarum]UOQ46072.1 potassium channel family protein [Halobacillus salinarum]
MKVKRRETAMQNWIRFYFRIPIFMRLLGTVLILMGLFGLIIHLLEPLSFPTIFDGIWWAFVTGATVGYGDYVPLSPAGKITGIVLILSGGGLVTFYMATLSAATVKHEQALSRGEVPYKNNGHLVLIGWNERTRQLIDMVQQYESQEKIVLIDRTMNEFYERLPLVHFIKGDASNEEILEKANVKEARIAVVTADPSKKEEQADQSVIHQTVALKGHHPQLFIIAEVLTERQKINAQRAGANTVIRSNDFMSSLFYHELYRNEPAQPFQLLLDLLTSSQFHEEELPEKLLGESMIKIMEHFLSENHLVIAVKKEKEINFHIQLNMQLERGDRLIVFTPLRS